MREAQKWSKDIPTWIGLFTKIYLTKLNKAIHFIMATKRRMLITFYNKSFVDCLEILLCEISPRSRRSHLDLGNLTSQKLAEILACMGISLLFYAKKYGLR